MEQSYQLHLVDLWGVAFGLALVFLFFTWRILFDEARRFFDMARTRYIMSRAVEGDRGAIGAESDEDRPVSSDETNFETTETPQYNAETIEEIFHFGENTAIARLIASGTIKLTEGVKEGTGKRSGDAYSKRSKEIQALVKKMQDRYPQRTPEQAASRQKLELDKPNH